MGFNAIITGSTGMVGKGVLLECLDHPQVEHVLVVNRQPLDMDHPKLTEIIHDNFQDLSSLRESFRDYQACFFCLGVSSIGLSEQDYTKITYDITLHMAQMLSELNPGMTFCYVSGAGTNPRGRSMWSRVKGKTEDDLQKLPFKQVYLFRPGYIQPQRGIRSKTGWYNAIYVVGKPLYRLIKLLASGWVTSTTEVGQAMIKSVIKGYHQSHLENEDINRLAAQ